MNLILRNVLAIIPGWVTGSEVNTGIVYLGNAILPLPLGHLNDMGSLAEVMPDLGFEYFIFPFAAHAQGTLAGVFVAARIAYSQKMWCALFIGIRFMLGGVAVNFMLTGPLWFSLSDLVLAYIPMARIGGLCGMGQTPMIKNIRNKR